MSLQVNVYEMNLLDCLEAAVITDYARNGSRVTSIQCSRCLSKDSFRNITKTFAVLDFMKVGYRGVLEVCGKQPIYNGVYCPDCVAKTIDMDGSRGEVLYASYRHGWQPDNHQYEFTIEYVKPLDTDGPAQDPTDQAIEDSPATKPKKKKKKSKK